MSRELSQPINQPTLLATVFITGACVLVLEILGTRWISPYYGASIYVWSALIVVTLLALSVGYAIGGWGADRVASRVTLIYGASATAGLWILAIPLFRGFALDMTQSLGVAGGVLASACILFAVPLALLGTVGPLVIRELSTSVERVGRSSGWVYAVSTLGSVLGALAAGFWLVPHFGVKNLTLTVGAALLLLGTIGFVRIRLVLPGMIAFWVLAAIAAFQAPRELDTDAGLPFSEDGYYGEVRVFDDHGVRWLFIEGVSHTAMNLETRGSALVYTDVIAQLPALRPQAKSALVVGLGGGVLPKLLENSYDIATDSVEIDPLVASVARRFFDYDPGERLFVDDGRRVIRNSKQTYDLIVLDAYSGDQRPAHLATHEFFQEVRKVLNPGGILALNVFGYVRGEELCVWEYIYKTLKASFPNVRVQHVGALDSERAPGSVILFASDEPLVLEGLEDAPNRRLERVWQYARRNELLPDAARLERAVVLTDDFNPTQTLESGAVAEMRENVRKQWPDLVL